MKNYQIVVYGQIGKTEEDAFLARAMLDQIAAAFDRKDYKTAAHLLKTFLQESPQNPWGQFYRGRWYEVTHQTAEAKAIYQQLLRDVSNPKIAAQARQAIQRLDAQDNEQRQSAIASATADPQQAELGILILEAISAAAKPTVAQTLAQILNLDLYTARLQLPSLGWRLLRTGPIGELRFYCDQLNAANIPAFCVTVSAVQTLPVYQVEYFEDFDPKAIVVCRNDQGQIGRLEFSWTELHQRVEGILPIFERVVDTTMREGIQRQRKIETQDFARVCDLHLPQRGCILRLCDWTYQFDQGIDFGIGTNTIELDQTINRLHWNRLIEFFNYHNIPAQTGFTRFAETAIDFAMLLKRIPRIDLFGQEDSLWNAAFPLYSGLVLLNKTDYR
jgi:hypothetical protein